MPGTVHHTYAAALQHDQADVPDDVTCIGIVRRPHGVVDDNLPALGPPNDLLDAAKAREGALQVIMEMVEDGEEVVLVCYEDTEEKRCHRTILKEWIESML